MVVVLIGQVGLDERRLEQLLWDDALLSQYPREHHAHQMPQDRLTLGQFLAVLHSPCPLCRLSVEPLPQRRNLQGGKEIVPSQTVVRISEHLQQLRDGGARGRRRQGRLENRRHVHLPTNRNRHPRLNRASRPRLRRVCEHDRNARLVRPSERPGAERRVRTVETRTIRIVPILHSRDYRMPASQGLLFGLYWNTLGVGVCLPVAVVRILANAVQTHVSSKIGLEDDARLVEHLLHDVLRTHILRNGNQELIGQVGRRQKFDPICRPSFYRLRRKQIHQSGDLITHLRFQRDRPNPTTPRKRLEVVLADELDIRRLWITDPAVDAPFHAVRQDAYSVLSTGPMLPQVPLNLPVGRAVPPPSLRRPVEIHVRAILLHFHDDRRMSRSIVYLAQEARLVDPPPRLAVFRNAMRRRIPQRLQQRQDENLERSSLVDQLAPASDVPKPIAQILRYPRMEFVRVHLPSLFINRTRPCPSTILPSFP